MAEPAKLDEALTRLATLLEHQFAVPRRVRLELAACADGGLSSNQPTVVVLGEYRRGKSTVVNRLLGQAIAPTALKQDRRPLRIRQPSGLATSGTIPVETCAAPILQYVEIVDTPSIARAEDDDMTAALRCIIDAAAVIFCTDARQALSTTEREILLTEILPLTSCPVLLAVTHLDRVLDPEDQQEIQELLDQHVKNLDDSRLELMMLSPGSSPDDQLPDLEGWITEVVKQQPPPIEDKTQRLSELLSLIETSLPMRIDPRAATAEQLERSLAILDREHRLALTEAAAVLRENLSQMQGELKAIVNASPETARGREGLTHIINRLKPMMESCGRQYLSTLHSALATDGPPALQTTSESIRIDASVPISFDKDEMPNMPSISRRGGFTNILEAASVAVTLALPGWGSILGAGITFATVNSWRRTRRARSETGDSADSVSALQSWLGGVESGLVETFSTSAENIVTEIREQVVKQFASDRPEEEEQAAPDEIASLIDHCRRFLSTELD